VEGRGRGGEETHLSAVRARLTPQSQIPDEHSRVRIDECSIYIGRGFLPSSQARGKAYHLQWAPELLLQRGQRRGNRSSRVCHRLSLLLLLLLLLLVLWASLLLFLLVMLP